MGAITGAIIASAVIGAGSSMYAADQQKQAANEDRDRREAAAAAQKAEADRIARETRPEEESLGEIGFGSGDGETGSSSDFLVAKKSTSGGLGSAQAGSGLGFSI